MRTSVLIAVNLGPSKKKRYHPYEVSVLGSPIDDAPKSLGPFRLLGVLGEGASGRVYRAAQDSPAREVALKVLRNASAGSDAARRFKRETELLAALEHPGIARLYVAGDLDTPTGPIAYIAMEYVRGRDVCAHATSRQLSSEDRVRLVVAICRAVHHAHTRGVIHRDLKPGNILVDESGAPRIVDFGIAHLSGHDQTQMTVAGSVLGTIPYMSREQLAGGPQGVDPRWDVYALGVIAYQLLSGELPHPGLAQQTSALTALDVIHRERARPLSALLPAARGDLETVVMKAMSDDPARRYASAAEFAGDLERYLERRPIDARPPTLTYTVGLFVRRYKALSAALALAILAVLGGAGASLWFGFSEARSRAEAESRAAELGAVNEFMGRMFEAATPEKAQGKTVTALEVLDAARKTLEAGDNAYPPRVLAQLRYSLGKAYLALSQPNLTLQLLDQALPELATAFAAGSFELLEARVLQVQAQREALRYVEMAQAIEALLPELPPSQELSRQRLRITVLTLALESQMHQGQLARAADQIAGLLQEADDTLGANAAETSRALEIGAFIYNEAARYDEVEPLVRRILKTVESSLGPQHPRTLAARHQLALLFRSRGDYAQAESHFKALLADRERILGPDHLDTMNTVGALTTTLTRLRKFAEAEPLAQRALRGWTRVSGPDDKVTLFALYDLVGIYRGLGRHREQLATAEDCLARLKQIKRPFYFAEWIHHDNHALALAENGRLVEARARYEDLLPRMEKEFPARYPLFLSNYGEVLRRQGERDRARQTLEQARKLMIERMPATHPAQTEIEQRLRLLELTS